MNFLFREKDKEAYLDRVREAVDHYSPMIESRTGISLGDINVKDMREYKEKIRTNARDLASSRGSLSTLTNYVIPSIGAGLIYPFLSASALMKTDTPNIYVAANFWASLNQLSGVGPDQPVVHELTHVLWDTLGGYNSSNIQSDMVCVYKKRNIKAQITLLKKMIRLGEWNEGFATYGDGTWFADFYPTGIKTTTLSGRYKRGQKLVKHLVERHGEQVLFQIPLKWEEFDRELHKS